MSPHMKGDIKDMQKTFKVVVFEKTMRKKDKSTWKQPIVVISRGEGEKPIYLECFLTEKARKHLIKDDKELPLTIELSNGAPATETSEGELPSYKIQRRKFTRADGTKGWKRQLVIFDYVATEKAPEYHRVTLDDYVSEIEKSFKKENTESDSDYPF